MSGVLQSGVEQTVTSGSLLLAAVVAVLAGLVSFASPCVLPLVPGYLSYVTGLTGADLGTAPGTGPSGASAIATLPVRGARRGRVLAGTVLFVAGFSAVFVAAGVFAGTLGTWLLTYADVLTRVLGVVTVVLGLVFLGLLDRLAPFVLRDARVHVDPPRGVWGAPLLGVLFGLGWTPCIGPTLGAVLTLAGTSGGAARGALLALCYCAGLGLPFVLVAVAFRRSMAALGWMRRHALTLQRAGGVMLVVLGLMLVTGTWTTVSIAMRTWVPGFVPAL